MTRSQYLNTKTTELLPENTFAMGLTMQVVHRFTEAGTISLNCGGDGSKLGPSVVEFKDLKLIAVQGSGLSNVFLGSQ